MNENTEISKEAIRAIADAILEYMQDRISNISPDDDRSVEYGKYWTEGRCESDDCVYLDGEFEDYCASFNYEVSWKYRVWDEYWTDPWCWRTFDDMKDECGAVWDVEVDCPDNVPQSAIKEIEEIVNREINL